MNMHKNLHQLFPLSSRQFLDSSQFSLNVVRVLLDTNRYNTGYLWVVDTVDEHNQSFAYLGVIDVLGKADNGLALKHSNSDRDPLKPYGDTPTGLWQVDKYVKHVDEDPDELTAYERSYGTTGFFRLNPLIGDSVRSYEEFGRSGILLHGGFSPEGRLRPTYGCLRVRDAHIAGLGYLFEHMSTTFDVIEVQEYDGGYNAWLRTVELEGCL